VVRSQEKSKAKIRMTSVLWVSLIMITITTIHWNFAGARVVVFAGVLSDLVLVWD
jgi:hypothetical protein